MTKHILSVLAFILCTFGTQGLSHFVINKDHFAQIAHLRPDPIMPMGFAVMCIQGILLSLALHAWRGGEATLTDGVKVALIFGLFLVSYIALTEPAKYTVPSIAAWIRVEVLVGAAQFGVFGVLMGYIHQRWG